MRRPSAPAAPGGAAGSRLGQCVWFAREVPPSAAAAKRHPGLAKCRPGAGSRTIWHKE